jgi:lipid II:glycine glycyltransferase (peptidoglycan interpeptide bridge formation enzyme)
MGINEGYTVQVDNTDSNLWHQVLGNFNDASLYQTWEFDSVRFGEKCLSHLILKRNNEIVAAAQVTIFKMPFFPLSLAYVRWGPMWQKKGEKPDQEIFKTIVTALYQEYVTNRNHILRIYPVLYSDEHNNFSSLLESERFKHNRQTKEPRTLLANLSISLEEVRKGFDQKWRGHLNRAEKNNLTIIEGCEDELFDTFTTIYNEMHARKQFEKPTDMATYNLIQKSLPKELKMRIFICKHNDSLCSGVVCSAMGNTGIYLLGATSNYGMKQQGAYLIQWKLIQWLKENNFCWYNLHVINPVKNPGNYIYKKGLGGKNARDITFLGNFDAFPGQIAKYIFLILEPCASYFKKIFSFIR